MVAGKSKNKVKVGVGLCGMPVTEGYGLMKARENCPKCASYKNVVRSCLKCGKPFRPGCKTPHSCAQCNIGKKVKEGEESSWIYFT